MPAPVFIGDELTAAGYRLGGAVVRVCDVADAAAELGRAREAAGLVLIAASHAEHVPETQLAAALAAVAPLVVIVADARGGPGLPDLAARVRRTLGVLP